MAEALAELEVHNISTAPKFGISYASLEDAATSQEACEHLFEQMKDAVGKSLTRLPQPAFTTHAPPVMYLALVPHMPADTGIFRLYGEAWIGVVTKRVSDCH